MILLSLGTHQQPFTRALDLVEPLAAAGEELVVQHGSTPPRLRVPHTTWVELMPFDELVNTMARARGVVCHAGVGTIITALRAGHMPLVLPRQARYGEHVDDHQLDITTRFAERGLIRCVADQATLEQLLVQPSHAADGQIGRGSEALRKAVSDAVEAPARRRAVLAR